MAYILSFLFGCGFIILFEVLMLYLLRKKGYSLTTKKIVDKK